ncbi:hypothetical protein [Phenylobacterium sp.]|jgi:hypothetical protein|uniref:hypothetical protein n=1 Tax=Phenylobacterium sp. TaxID=1871053 RepID=UPI002F40064F
MNRRLFILASLALGGCATAVQPPPAPVAPARAPLGELEPLYSAVAGPAGLTIRVASNGCATAPDFGFYVERRPAGVTIAFARRRLTPCRSAATSIAQQEVAFSWGELGIDARTPVFVLNPLVAGAGPGS